MEWISIDKDLPKPRTRVKLSYGCKGIRAAVCDQWISEGWLTDRGVWVVDYVYGLPKYPKPTHWKHL